jgi:hypothetical protein
MAKANETKIIEVNVNLNTEPRWTKAFVTWEDEDSMRVTPVNGDPRYSIHIDKKCGKSWRII